jgi:hypothetical protein
LRAAPGGMDWIWARAVAATRAAALLSIDARTESTDSP